LWICNLQRMNKPYTIGITGGSGSGKTSFIKQLASHFTSEQICLISQDNYYKPKELQFIDEAGVENFDLPDAINREAFIHHIMEVKSGREVSLPEYTFNNPAAVPKIIHYHPAPILIVEGLFIFGYPEIENQLDLKVYIEAKDHIKLTRRILRDNVERGYDLNDVLYRYENHVMPVYETYISPLKATAHFIIPNNKDFTVALAIIVEYLKKRV
jgi:uridine kinase